MKNIFLKIQHNSLKLSLLQSFQLFLQSIFIILSMHPIKIKLVTQRAGMIEPINRSPQYFDRRSPEVCSICINGHMDNPINFCHLVGGVLSSLYHQWKLDIKLLCDIPINFIPIYIVPSLFLHPFHPRFFVTLIIKLNKLFCDGCVNCVVYNLVVVWNADSIFLSVFISLFHLLSVIFLFYCNFLIKM